jgi:hypothetical protein
MGTGGSKHTGLQNILETILGVFPRCSEIKLGRAELIPHSLFSTLKIPNRLFPQQNLPKLLPTDFHKYLNISFSASLDQQQSVEVTYG